MTLYTYYLASQAKEKNPEHVTGVVILEETSADLMVSESSDSDESTADSSSEEEDDDDSTLVVDLGSYKIKGGFAGDDAPRAVFR